MHIDWSAILSQFLVPLLIAAGAFVINFLLPKLPGATAHLFDWLKSHTAGIKNAYAKGILDRLITLAGQKVLALENTEIEFLKQEVAAGRITKDQLPALLKGIKDKAMELIKADANAQGIWKIALQIFLGDTSALSNWLGGVVESHVAQLPSSGLSYTMAKPSEPAPAKLASDVPLAASATPAAPAVPPLAAP